MDRTARGGARVALLALLLSILVIPPVSAGPPLVSCVDFTWTGDGGSTAWEVPENWKCTDGPPVAPGYPNGVGHTAIFDGADAVDEVVISVGDVVLDTLDANGLFVNVVSPSGVVIRAVEGLIVKTGSGELLIEEDLSSSTGLPFVHLFDIESNNADSFREAQAFNGAQGDVNTSRVDIHATGDSGSILHLTDGLTIIDPAGPGQVDALNPGALGACDCDGCDCGDCDCLEGGAFAGPVTPPCGDVCEQFLPWALLLFEGGTVNVDIQADGADLIDAYGPVLLDIDSSAAPEALAFASPPAVASAGLDVSVNGLLHPGATFPIVQSFPVEGMEVEGNGDVVDPCDVWVPYGICGQFEGYGDGYEFRAGDYWMTINYVTQGDMDGWPELAQRGWSSDAARRAFAGDAPAWVDDIVVEVTLTVDRRVSGPNPPTDPPPPPPPPPGPPLPPAQEPLEPTRLGGDERIETSVIGSQEAFEDGAAGAVVLATAENPADAVTGTPFAVAQDAPILLTHPEQLTPIVAEEIQRILGVGKTVYVMGLGDAISDGVVAEIEALGYEVQRIGGVNRFATAVEVADRLLGAGFAQTDGQALLADGHGFIAATLAGPAAAAIDGVVLLTAGEDMAPETAAWLSEHTEVDTTAIGDEAAAASPKSDVVEGDTAPELSVAVAEAFFDQPSAIGVATYVTFPDPLTGGTHVALRGGPLLLSDREELPAAVAEYVSSIGSGLDELSVYGGTAALSEAVAEALAEAAAAGE